MALAGSEPPPPDEPLAAGMGVRLGKGFRPEGGLAGAGTGLAPPPVLPLPELPEVETVARDLAAQARGRVITGVTKLDWPRMIETPDEAGFRAGIAGRRILEVGRRAKWVLATLDGGLTLAVHLRMSGSLV